MNIEIWNFIAAIIGVVLALYAIAHTHISNKASIAVNDIEFYKDEYNPTLLSFEICNTSGTPISVKNLSFLDDKGDVIKYLMHEPKGEPHRGPFDIPSPIMLWQYEKHVKSNTVIQPFQNLEVRYYICPTTPSFTVEIECDKNVKLFKKTKSFLVDANNL